MFTMFQEAFKKASTCFVSSKVFFLPCFQTFLLQKLKLMFWLQRSQHKAHFLINKMKSFHSGTSEVYKSGVIWTVLLECVYSGVFNVSSSRVSHGPDFLCFIFQRQNKVPWEVNSVFPYRKKYLLCLSFIETEKYTISPLEQWGYT